MPVHPDTHRMIVYAWSAAPAGGAITITGRTVRGEVVKLRPVKRVESGMAPRGLLRRPVLVVQAVMADGTRHTLA